MTLEVWDWLRWVNAGLAGLVVVLLVAGAVARWRVMPKRFQRITPWVVATYVVVAYSSGEIAAADEPVAPGLRVVLLMVVLLGLLGALVWRFGASDYD